MNDNLLQEYKEYYSVRAERYAGNPNYANSYLAEKNLSDAMQSCSTLAEFKDKIGDLNERCAVALVKDEALIEKAHFEKHKEDVRKKTCLEVLERVDSCKTALDVASMVIEVSNKNSIEISMDEAHRLFQDDWDLHDNYLIYSQAVVPDKYKQSMQKSAEDMKNSMLESVNFVEKNNQEWQAGWRLIPEKNTEYRHRRLLPYRDEHIAEKLASYKTIVNR